MHNDICFGTYLFSVHSPQEPTSIACDYQQANLFKFQRPRGKIALSHKIKLVLFPLASGKPSMPDTVDSTVAFIFYIFFLKLDFVFDSLK